MNPQNAFTIITGIWAASTFILNRRTEKIKTIREYNRNIQVWADIAIDLMSSAGHLCDVDPSKDEKFYEKRHNMLVCLSSHIDKGRLFFTNTGIDKYGHHKPSAYRGFRSAALDHLVACYDITRSLDFKNCVVNKDKRNLIMDQKKLFVSVIQEKLDPNKVESDIKTIF